MARTTTAIFIDDFQDRQSATETEISTGELIGVKNCINLSIPNQRSVFCEECGWKLHLRQEGHFAHNPAPPNIRPWCSSMVYVNDQGVVTRQSDINELQRRGMIVELDFPPLNPQELHPREPRENPEQRDAPNNFTSIDTLAQHLPVYLNKAIRVNGAVRIISDMLKSSEIQDGTDNLKGKGPFIWFARIEQFNPSFHDFLNFDCRELPRSFRLTKEVSEYRRFNPGNIENRVILAYGEYGDQIIVEDGRKIGRLPEQYEFLLGY